MELSIQALPARVSRLRRAARRFATVYGGASPDDVALAIQEAVANAVIHGYTNTPGIVRLLGVRRAAEMVFVVEDYGSGLAPAGDSPGLGLVVIAGVTEEVEITSFVGYGTRVRMTFAVVGAGRTEP
jgi:stage II sporulation protein AB (anti-sigma F factor)